MLRLVDRPVMPSSTPICGRKPATSRFTGDHTTVSFLPRMRRAIWNPQRWGVLPPRRGYRRLLNGMAISAVNPSCTTRPAESKRVSHDRSPRGGPKNPLGPPPSPPPPPNPPPPPPRALRIASVCTPYALTVNTYARC